MHPSRGQISVPNIGAYSFGFNGQEKLNETYGEGNAYDFGARIYDPRIGRFLSRDPWENRAPFWTSYNFGGNNPIQLIERNGENPILPLIIAGVIKTAAMVTGRVSYYSMTGSALAGFIDFGTGAQANGAFAADPHGNYAFIGTIGAFFHFAGGNSWSSTGAENGKDNGGNWFGGIDIGISVDIGYYQSKTNVLDLSGSGKAWQISGGMLAFQENLTENGGYDGVQLSLGMGAEGGVGQMDGNSYVFAFTLGDIADIALQQTLLMKDYIKEKAGSIIDKENPYYSIGMKYTAIAEGNRTTIIGEVWGKDKEGDVQTLSKRTIAVFDIDNDVVSTPNVSKRDNRE